MIQRLKLCLALATVLAACGPEKPACSPESLAALEAAYVRDVLAACEGHPEPEACPAFKAIEAEYEQKREEWVRCN